MQQPKLETEALPQAIEIEKDGSTTRLYNALTGHQIEGDIKVKLDFTSGNAPLTALQRRLLLISKPSQMDKSPKPKGIACLTD